MGIRYISYHACPNDFILYRGKYVDKEICQECGHDKYYKSKNKGNAHGPPHNILRHMFVIQRLFLCKQLVILQRWNASHRSDSIVLWILVDSIAMKHIEDTWPDKFKEKVQSLRLSIAIDGVNLYFLENANYYVCPMVVINNDIPPWLFMHNEHMMLALIVLGRRQVKRMDTYLQSLIDELKHQNWCTCILCINTCPNGEIGKEPFL